MRNLQKYKPPIQGRKTLKALDSQLQKALQRIVRLERMVAENGLEEPHAFGEPEKRGKGRPSGITQEELIRRAPSLVLWLEDNWPEISLGLKKARSEEDIAEALRSGRRHTYRGPAFYKEPERFASVCWRFINAERKANKFRGNPRNLAAAMAGLPEISARTSFNRCGTWTNQKCHPVGYRAYRDYLQRNFSDRFLLLLKATSPEEVAKILRGSHSRDKVVRYLRENPDKVLYWLECGKPGNTHMDVEPGNEHRG
jgi:hypothetical protein